MLTIVMAKPIDVTMVNAVPLFVTAADCATRVENCGESDTTVNPQINKTNRKKTGDKLNVTGERRQHIPETSKE